MASTSCTRSIIATGKHKKNNLKNTKTLTTKTMSMFSYFYYYSSCYLDYIALGNMPVEKETCLDDCSWKTVRFKKSPRMSTYLLAFVVADFRYTEKILPGNYAVSYHSELLARAIL